MWDNAFGMLCIVVIRKPSAVFSDARLVGGGSIEGVGVGRPRADLKSRMVGTLSSGTLVWGNLALGLVTNKKTIQEVSDYDFFFLLVKLSGEFKTNFFGQ